MENAAQEVKKDIKPVEKKRPALKDSRFEYGSSARNYWVVTTEAGTKPEDLLDPAYWAHVCRKMKPFDRIEARSDDGSFFAEYVVTHVSNVEAKVFMLYSADLINGGNDVEESGGKGLEAKWRGPLLKWSVVRTADGAALAERLDSKSDALKYILEHNSTG